MGNIESGPGRELSSYEKRERDMGKIEAIRGAKFKPGEQPSFPDVVLAMRETFERKAYVVPRDQALRETVAEINEWYQQTGRNLQPATTKDVEQALTYFEPADNDTKQ